MGQPSGSSGGLTDTHRIFPVFRYAPLRKNALTYRLFRFWVFTDCTFLDISTNINSKIARDINLIQTVYTFCDYYVKYPDTYSSEEIKKWLDEKELLETDIGFSIYEKLVENNSSFDIIFREETFAKNSRGLFNVNYNKDKSQFINKCAMNSSADYHILSYTELQAYNSNIDNIKSEISSIVSGVLSEGSHIGLDCNLTMLESISENWRVILDGNDNLVGYWVFVALPDEMYLEAKTGKLDEKDITLETIEYIDLPGIYNGYLLMSGIKPAARTSTLVQLLYESLARHIESLAKKGIFFKEIVCVAESASAKSALKKMGLSAKCDHLYGGQIYSVDMSQVSSNRYFSSFEALKDLYCSYFENTN